MNIRNQEPKSGHSGNLGVRNIQKFEVDNEQIDQIINEDMITPADSKDRQTDSSTNNVQNDNIHRRMHSDYSNTPINAYDANEQRDQALTKKVIDLLESGLNYLNQDKVEDSLREFKIAEQLFIQSRQQNGDADTIQQLDDNYLSVLKYNLSCCFQRMGLIDQCIACLQEAIDALDQQIKTIKEKNNISLTEKSISQQQLSINSNMMPTSIDNNQDIEAILGNLLHKYRYQCKFHLQVCAVLSQMNKHDQAYVYGDKAAKYAILLMHKAFELCQLFVQEINKKREQMQQKVRRSSAVSGAQSLDEGDDYQPLAQTQNQNHLQFSPYGMKHNSVTQNNTNMSQTSLQQRSIHSQAAQIPQQVQVNNYFASSTRNNSVCNRSQDSQSNTRVNIRRASSADGSLERIHTFNLKLQKLQNQKSGITLNPQITNVNAQNSEKNVSNINVSKINLNQNESNSRNITQLNGNQQFHTTTSANSQSGNQHKVYYVEEKTKVLENIIIKVQPTINEFQRIIKEFEIVQDTKEHERQSMFGTKRDKQKHALKISFHDDTEINLIKFNHKFKLNVRNILGIKHQDDWIFNLNIGNVMHLTPMNTDELAAKLDRTHELNKDAMLEKIILFVVSFFCVGTELRFLSQKEGSGVSKKDSEMWHAKALHTSCLFLPEECPLVNHIINSYKKHHLNPKAEQLKQKKQDEEQRRKRDTEEQNSKEQSLGLGGFSTIQGTSKQSQEGNNSQSIGDDHEAMKEIKQQIENFLQKSKKSSGQNTKANISKITSNSGQQSARPFSHNNMAQINKNLHIEPKDDEINERRKSNLINGPTNNSRNQQIKHNNTAQQNNHQQAANHQLLISTNSVKNLGPQNQKNIVNLQSMNPQLFQTMQTSTAHPRKNQSPQNVFNDSIGSSVESKPIARQTQKRLSTNFHSSNQEHLQKTAKGDQKLIMNTDQLQTEKQFRRMTGYSPDNITQKQFQFQFQVQHPNLMTNQQQQTSQMGSQNSSIISGVKSRPLSPRNAILMGLNNQMNRQNSGNRAQNKSPTNYIAATQQQNQNLQKISSQIIEQILKKTSPLEQAIKPNQSTYGPSNNGYAINQPQGILIPGPKKILVFPNKKKFPLASMGGQTAVVLNNDQRSPKGYSMDKKLKMSGFHGMTLNTSKSQRSLGSSKNRGNTPVNNNKKSQLLVGANQIQMHYQTNQSRNLEQDGEDNIGGLTKYKSLENFPIDEILSELTKQQQKLKIKTSHSNLGSNERPSVVHGSSILKQNNNNKVKSAVMNGIQQSQNMTYSQRMGSPVNHALQYSLLNNQQQQQQSMMLHQQHQNHQQQQQQVLNYNFQNINFINNVNIFEDKKKGELNSTGGSLNKMAGTSEFINGNQILTSQPSSSKNSQAMKLSGPRKSQGSQISKYLK